MGEECGHDEVALNRYLVEIEDESMLPTSQLTTYTYTTIIIATYNIIHPCPPYQSSLSICIQVH